MTTLGAVRRRARALAERVTSHAAFLFRGRPPLRLWRLDDGEFRRELERLAEEHIQLLVVAPRALSDEQVRRDFRGWSPLDIPSIQDSLKHQNESS